MDKTDRAKLRKDKPEVWVPVDPGDFIRGTVVEIAAAWSDAQFDGRDPDSGFYPLLRIDATEAPGYTGLPKVLAVHAFAAVLQSRILDHEPAPGETVVITYEGTGEKTQRGRSAPELFRLALPDRDPQQIAANVYGKLRGKRGHRPAAPQADPETGEVIA